MELLKEMLPKITRVAFMWDSANPGLGRRLKAVKDAAQNLGVTVQSLEVRNSQDLESAFEAVAKGRAGALIVPEPIIAHYRRQFVDLTAKNAAKKRPPLIYDTSESVEEARGLMSYGPSGTDLYRRAATYVDKILKGAKPGDLPVEQPMKFELVINLRAAKQIGLTIPQSVLYRADKVIK